MKRIATTLLLALLVLVGTSATSFSWTHIETTKSSLQFPPTSVGSSSIMSYTINYLDGGSNEPVKIDVSISADAVTLFQCQWDNTNGLWSNFPPSEWSFTAGNASRILYVRYTPTDTVSGSKGGITNQMYFNFPGAGWFDGNTVPISLSSSPLPVELSAFTIKNAKKNTVELDWTTVSETNNYGFYVQKSADGKSNFATLGFVPGQGTTLSTHNYSYADNAAPFTFYRLKQVDLDGLIHYSNTISPGMTETAPMNSPKLEQNFPNPFNPSTQISFSITKEGPVSLRVYDILGREVATLVNENRKAGQYTEQFNGNQMVSGVYVYVLKASEGQLTCRMMLLK